MAKRITKSQEIEIIRLYTEESKSSKEISEIIGVSSSSVLRVLKRNNVGTRSKAPINMPNKFSKEKEQEIIRLYTEENKSTVEIANIFGTYNTSIRRVLERNNVRIRSYSEARRFVELEDISSKEGTNDFDYFLGLLATDGCVTNNKIILDFSEENKELLDYWNEFLGNKCNISISIHKVFKVPQYRISFRNKEVADYFATFGIIPRKSFDLKLKYINWNVLRGIIDGDGCVSTTNTGNTVKLGITSACKGFLVQIQDFLKEEGFTSFINKSYRNKNPIYDLFVYKTSDLIEIYKRLYDNAHYFLKRKRNNFGPILKKFNDSNSVNSVNDEHPKTEPSLNKEGAETRNGESKE